MNYYLCYRMDAHRPYSPEKGCLKEYLRERDGTGIDNLFFGPEYFFVFKERGWLLPRSTVIRVDKSPVPDIAYMVNLDFLLESSGRGKENMSLVGASRGVYEPDTALRDRHWSIYGLNLE